MTVVKFPSRTISPTCVSSLAVKSVIFGLPRTASLVETLRKLGKLMLQSLSLSVTLRFPTDTKAGRFRHE